MKSMNYLVSSQNSTHGGVVRKTDDYPRAIAAAIRDSLDVADPVVVYAVGHLGNIKYECAVIENGEITWQMEG